ncbi:hypothetical protein ACPTGD_14600, partial [Enterococcus faecalis]|uniref:hypothetical protein n=1 Tax=Enterococcus faecalis TaxID=1351 RepID=UPI003CC6BD5D
VFVKSRIIMPKLPSSLPAIPEIFPKSTNWAATSKAQPWVSANSRNFSIELLPIPSFASLTISSKLI